MTACVRVSNCLSVLILDHLSARRFIVIIIFEYVSVRLYVCPSTRPSACMFSLRLYVSLSVSILSFVRASDHPLSVHLFVRLPVRLYVCSKV